MDICPSCKQEIPAPPGQQSGVLTPDDVLWPRGFAGLNEYRPAQLYFRGNADLLAEPGLAIVGSRAATAYGTNIAQRLAENASTNGYVVVSGGAFGIDAAAHRASVHRTIVVLPAGIDRMYPSAHAEMFRGILRAGGLLVSEYPEGRHPTRTQFLDRNRLIAALSLGTVVVEAGRRSGSMSMAGATLKLGPRLMAVPGPVTSAQSEGCHQLIRDYQAKLVSHFEDVKTVMGPLPL